MPKRKAGVLLHISSLPSAYGIGDFGPAAYAFANTLADAGLTCWQFLPLTPTSEFIGNSPYSSPSAFAGNPLFISPEMLCQNGYISYADLENFIPYAEGHSQHANRVDYGWAAQVRRAFLNAAFERNMPHLATNVDFIEFCNSHAFWLDDYALFSAIKEEHGGASWVIWPVSLKWRNADALKEWACKHERQIMRHKFIQFLFFSQLQAFRMHCRECGLTLIGDLPIYVTHDSADVWAAPELFKLDNEGMPVDVAGVPPDYFSATGQRWGNPVYNWSTIAESGFVWWKRRLVHNQIMADLVRLDHFRGFAAFWEIPASEPTAEHGKWSSGPGESFFYAMQDEFGSVLPIIAEDLGLITDDVRALMEKFGLPGMKVLHFAFGGEKPWENPDAPFSHSVKSVVYTGTHDNDTTIGWFNSVSEQERQNFCNYIGSKISATESPEAMIRLALESAAEIAIIPMQDILELGSEARMNTPSVAHGNWVWRLESQEGWSARGASGFCIDKTTEHQFETGIMDENRKGSPESCAKINNNFSVPEIFAKLHRLCWIYGRLGHLK